MTKEQKTIQKIQEACPEIMELKFGCEISFNNSDSIGYIIKKDNMKYHNGLSNYYFCYFNKLKEGGVMLHSNIIRKIPLSSHHIKILGRPIILEDVLITCKKYFNKRFEEKQNENCDQIDNITADRKILNLWQLNKPFSQQSQETKDFIGDLILKK